jgi:DNA invertase Pin-like site-specific DNA recombinase
MEDAHKRRYEIAICWKFDRFARSVSHLLRALETFRALGVEFVSLTEQVDTTTPVGKMIYTVLGSVSELERCLTVERVRAGMRNARAKGRHIGRPALRRFSNTEREEIQTVHRKDGTSVRQLAIRYGTTQWMMSRILRGQYVGS